MYIQKDSNKGAGAEKTKTIEVTVTRHCIERLKERIMPLRDKDEEAIIKSLNEKLSEGFMYYDENSGATVLRFENMTLIFIIVANNSGTGWNAVTVKHTIWFSHKGNPVKILYKDNNYDIVKRMLANDKESMRRL
ncbi:MAG: hypothetical protein QXU16_02790 [Candidatus Micrarchaeaceae archaeon]